MLAACGESGSKKKYPEQSITGVVQWGAGGAMDNVSRAIAPLAEKSLGQSIVITNKPGATGSIAMQYVHEKKADGYNLLFSAENPALYGVLQISNQSFEDFYPINIMARGVATVVVPNDSKYQTMSDLIKDTQANQGKIKMGSTGPGGLPFMVTTMIESVAKTKFNMVPFDGEGPGMTALLGKHVDVLVVGLTAAAENAKAGKVRILAVVNDEKLKDFPDVPAITEALPEVKKFLPWGPFYGVWVKKDAPDDVKKTLVKAFAEAQKEPEFQDFLTRMGAVSLGISGDEADKFWRDWQSTSAWLLQDAGVAKASPEQLNIPRKK
ncbi:tricarboxylate transport protein TctC [Cohnella kolymensis]|uniref:Tricarboxylate transport protein TctC n=1 Tax=Cohnella kolymensis TaxID=1590652 RepID=A0ABR5A9N7_9BACL|nr:tricarboxylate transport protein TctC [Cohnella kolymensis]